MFIASFAAVIAGTSQFLPSTATAARPAATPRPGINLPPPSALKHETFWRTLVSEWKVDLLHFIEHDLPKLIIIALVTFVLVQILLIFTRRLKKLADPATVGPGRAAQIRTLASVIKTAGWAIIIFHAIVQTLEIFGINVTPLLASAGVAGVAVGFGAQTIVHDVINGMLILMENQFNVGDVVKIAGLTGTVEDMSLRRVTMRDGGDGSIYTVPNSQITTVSNMTRDWSQIQVNISVDYRENPDRVIAVLQSVAEEVVAEPAFKHVMSGAPTVLGIDAFKGSEVIYPVLFKTRVNGQWGVAREFRRLLKIRFDKERMLLGDPQRVYNYPPAANANSDSQPVAQSAVLALAQSASAPQASSDAAPQGTVSQTDTTPKS